MGSKRETHVSPQGDETSSFGKILFFRFQVISDVELGKLIAIIRKFGMEFRESLVFDRIGEELRQFCAAHTVDEVRNVHIWIGLHDFADL